MSLERHHVFGSVRNATCLPLIPTSTVGDRYRVRVADDGSVLRYDGWENASQEVHRMDAGGCGLAALLLALVLGLGAFVAMPAEVSDEGTAAPMVVEVSPSP
jgi:hypothetical protein